VKSREAERRSQVADATNPAYRVGDRMLTYTAMGQVVGAVSVGKVPCPAIEQANIILRAAIMLALGAE
jgi:hypothetical protein